MTLLEEAYKDSERTLPAALAVAAGQERYQRERRRRLWRNRLGGPRCDHYLFSGVGEPRRPCRQRARFYSYYNKLKPAERYYHCASCVSGGTAEAYSVNPQALKPWWSRLGPPWFRPKTRSGVTSHAELP